MGWLNRSQGKQIAKWLYIRIFQRQVLTTITALAGGGKAGATQLNHGINRITVCATNADSVLAPVAFAGTEFIVINDGAASVTIFGKGTDTIDAVATATGNPMAAAKRALFTCDADGRWQSCAGAKIT